MTQSRVPTLSNDIENHLYAKRQKIYPREVHGIFARLRIVSVLALLGIYYFVPWINWNDRQAILFDLPARKFYIFEWVFWPQDFIYLSALLTIAALALFFFTALAGRLWCGYACPQTVWTETFMWMERMIEGNRGRQMKLDKAAFSGHKFFLKSSKHVVWILFSLWTGFTFVGYFTPIRELAVNVVNLQTGPWETFWILFYAFATYGNAGWLREQVCIYMCPYARFQSAMFDKNTLIISYDQQRGEPRGSRKRGADEKPSTLGDCIDCTLCVQVCPTGIDIRKGLQYECIGCAACIDACDEVMDKMGYAKGLIRYTTENALAGIKTRVLRPRVIMYGFILCALLVAVGYSITQRPLVELDVIRDRNALFQETDEGDIVNIYSLRILNKSNDELAFTIEAEGLDGFVVLTDQDQIKVASGAVQEVPVRLQTYYENVVSPSNNIEFVLRSADVEDVEIVEAARFLGPQ